MILTKNIVHHFGAFKALDHVSFEINKGEIVGFLGQNGAGKTTLMRILTTFLTPDSGQALVAGLDVFKDSYAIRQKIGYLPENPPLYKSMSVKDYLIFAARLKDVPERICGKRLADVLEECHLHDVQNKRIGTLSKGYRQRVGIAQAIIHNPEILILDEPTSGLDPVQNLSVRNLIKSFEGRRTVILSTHILSEIEHVAKRILLIKQGRIILDQHLTELLAQEKDTLENIFLRLHGVSYE